MNPEAESPAPAIDAAVLLRGGADLVVRMFADEQKKEIVDRTILVRLLDLERALTLLALVEDYYAVADMVTDNPAGWSRSLVAPDSVLEIVEKGLDINFHFARRLAELRAKHAKLAAAFRNPLAGSPSQPVSSNSAPTRA